MNGCPSRTACQDRQVFSRSSGRPLSLPCARIRGAMKWAPLGCLQQDSFGITRPPAVGFEPAAFASTQHHRMGAAGGSS